MSRAEQRSRNTDKTRKTAADAGLFGWFFSTLRNRSLLHKMNTEMGFLQNCPCPIFFSQNYLGEMIFGKLTGKKFEKALLIFHK